MNSSVRIFLAITLIMCAGRVVCSEKEGFVEYYRSLKPFETSPNPKTRGGYYEHTRGKDTARYWLRDTQLCVGQSKEVPLDLSTLKYPGINFNRAFLSGIYLRNAQLPKSSFRKAYIRDVDLTNADLSNSDWTGVKLESGVTFTGANLGGMKGLEHRKTSLYETDFRGARNMPTRQKFYAKDKDAQVDLNRTEERDYRYYKNPSEAGMLPGSY